MTGLAEIFAELGIAQYLKEFIDQGFDTWETILDIKETDFDALGVKLGHRRKLQRKIANARGISTDRALESPTQSGNDGADDVKESGNRVEGKQHGANSGSVQGAKRKYRRHPKTDENAPERPPSAYVIFSNKMRDDLKGRNLSFTEIAKLVGEHWQNLSAHEKEPFENDAAMKKEKYLGQLVEYKKTEQYREYTAYLIDFKARQQNQSTGSDADSSKRPKLASQHASANSTGTTSSGTSHGPEPNVFSRDGSVGSTQWPSSEQGMPYASNTSNLNRTLVTTRLNDSNYSPVSSALPGYRESIIFGGNTSNLSLREMPREETTMLPRIPPMSTFSDIRPGILINPRRDALPPLGSLPSNPSSQSSNPPSLVTHESTNSNTSSGYHQPQTPLESPGDRTLPPIYPQKLPGHFDTPLPSIRPPSLSPQTSVAGPLHSPNVHGEYSSARGYGRPPPPTLNDHRSAYSSSNNSEETLQAFNHLLKAVNTVNPNSSPKSHNTP